MAGRAKEPKPAEIDKFMRLDSDKRDRIINAAMKEFRYGFKRASTDNIFKEAGISKGLLFHYFGTKEQLYIFMVNYVTDLIQRDYDDLFSLGIRDVLEMYWQAILLRKNSTDKHPFLRDFINGAYTHMADAPVEIPEIFEKTDATALEQTFAHLDMAAFRDDVDHKKVIYIISLTLDCLISDNCFIDEEEMKDYLEIFKKCFYK